MMIDRKPAMTRQSAIVFGAILLLLSTVYGCDDSSESEEKSVAISFEVMVGDEILAVGDTYEDVGTNDNSLTVSEAAFYAHGFELVAADGSARSISLDEDSPFQHDGHVLLDFSRDDQSPEPELTENRVVTGTVPDGTYDTLRFRVGVAAESNHLDVAQAPAPLNVAGMFWAWVGGYKFVRIDGDSDGLEGFRFHLGSTGCTAPEGDPGAATCTTKNVAAVELSDFDPDTDTVVLDIGELFADADLSSNTADTPPGCMSSPTDPDCAPVFDKLGLAHPSQEQEPSVNAQVFRLAN
jgi:uncharacterized repeat protein (TIGR04052 family)